MSYPPQGVADMRTQVYDPDRDGLIALAQMVAEVCSEAGVEILTNKTLTSPTINGAIITTGLTLPAFNLATNSVIIIPGTSPNFSMIRFEADGNYLDVGGNSGAGVSIIRLFGAGIAAVRYEVGIQMAGGALDVAGQYATFLERVAPGAGAANEVRVYAVVDGGELTDLAAVFQDGTVDLFAQEVTPLDAPIFTYPSKTKATLLLKKEHPGSVRIVAVFANGKEFTLKEIEYHDSEKIAANKGCESPLPEGWEVTTLEERVKRNVDALDKQLDGLSVQSAKMNNEYKANTVRLKELGALDELTDGEIREREALQERQLSIPVMREETKRGQAELEQKRQKELARLQ